MAAARAARHQAGTGSGRKQLSIRSFLTGNDTADESTEELCRAILHDLLRDIELPPKTKKSSSKRTIANYRVQWEDEFPWLESGLKGPRCMWCRNHNMSNVFATESGAGT